MKRFRSSTTEWTPPSAKESNDYRPLRDQLRNAYGLAVDVWQGELGRFVSHFQRFLRKLFLAQFLRGAIIGGLCRSQNKPTHQRASLIQFFFQRPLQRFGF